MRKQTITHTNTPTLSKLTQEVNLLANCWTNWITDVWQTWLKTHWDIVPASLRPNTKTEGVYIAPESVVVFNTSPRPNFRGPDWLGKVTIRGATSVQGKQINHFIYELRPRRAVRQMEGNVGHRSGHMMGVKIVPSNRWGKMKVTNRLGWIANLGPRAHYSRVIQKKQNVLTTRIFINFGFSLSPSLNLAKRRFISLILKTNICETLNVNRCHGTWIHFNPFTNFFTSKFAFEFVGGGGLFALMATLLEQHSGNGCV